MLGLMGRCRVLGGGNTVVCVCDGDECLEFFDGRYNLVALNVHWTGTACR